MIGKVNDMVSGAVVIGSMTQDYAAGTAAQRPQDQSGASAASVDELQKAKQVVLEKGGYTTKHRLFPEKKQA